MESHELHTRLSLSALALTVAVGSGCGPKAVGQEARSSARGASVVEGSAASRGAVDESSSDAPGAREARAPMAVPLEVRAPTDVEGPPALEVLELDCFSEYEHKAGEGLRSHRGGGPYGAAWNWYGGSLECRVRVRSSCRGDAVATLRVGDDYVSAQGFSLGGDGPAEAETRPVSFTVAAHHWERELEASEVFPFETLTVVVRVDARCVTPPHVDAEPAHRVEGFVARFSGGE